MSVKISLYLLIILHAMIISDGQPIYDPPDNIAIDCGSAATSFILRGRKWEGDIASKLFPSKEGQNQASIDSQVSGTVIQGDSVPYKTARLSRFDFSYTVPVSPGPKFVRFHFHSSAYSHQDFDISKAFFSVRAGNFTLLSNFSISMASDFLGRQDFVREFVVAVETSRLNVTFIPSSSVAGSFALVNGIEVVSMPENLYYPKSVDAYKIQFVGQTSPYNLVNTTAMATMYRINIGGAGFAGNTDTGMYRDWEAEGDEYLTIPGYSVLPVTNHKINFNDKVPAYTAPEGVYTTGRSTGYESANLVTSYRLTWQFPVHSGFQYLVRLHFCEIEPELNKTGDRVFVIYITDELVDASFDIVGDSGGQYTPYVASYVVSALTKPNISVALQVNPDYAMTAYLDAILNGVEIFKLSNHENNLAGPNPVVNKAAPNVIPSPSGNRKSTNRRIIGIVAGVVFGLIVLFVTGFFVIRQRRKVKVSTSEGSSTLPSDRCCHFSLAEIKAATNNFEDVFVIGVGGFGNVYKGLIDNGITPVAIKRLKSKSSQGAHEFKTEIEMLSHLRHRHLVSLIGYCDDEGEMILVYEYMSRGTLQDHLYKTDNPPLPWKTRLHICIGAARGLDYLHMGATNTIIHRDVKTTNILLDEKWAAKVSDFGLSKMGSMRVSKSHITTEVKGSIGYLDPEYYRRQQLSEKSDVYSFGVVLFEVLAGRPPILRNAENKDQISLVEWAHSCQQSGSWHQIVDPQLTGKIAPECLKNYCKIAVKCMLDDGAERPSMKEVVWGLEFVLQLQQNAEENGSVGGGALLSSNGETKSDLEEVAFLNSDGDVKLSCSWDDTPT